MAKRIDIWSWVSSTFLMWWWTGCVWNYCWESLLPIISNERLSMDLEFLIHSRSTQSEAKWWRPQKVHPIDAKYAVNDDQWYTVSSLLGIVNVVPFLMDVRRFIFDKIDFVLLHHVVARANRLWLCFPLVHGDSVKMTELIIKSNAC